MAYGKPRARTLPERFWSKVQKAEGDGCWLWTASLLTTGYGQIRIGDRNHGAHRVSWELANGRPVPDGLSVLHRCDVRACVRPDHLYVGTKQQNAVDTHSRGRWRYVAPGEGKQRRTSPPRRRGPKPRPWQERFWEKVDKSGGPDACWPWLGGMFRDGYGRFSPETGPGRQLLKAHRLAYQDAVGPIPDGLHILHSCDNRPCCNPRHLRAGTNGENVRDREERGRGGDFRGTKNGRAKITEEQAREILAALVAGETQFVVAERFGIKQPQVSRIARGEQWRHLSQPPAGVSC